MKRAQKEVLKAGLVNYLAAKVRENERSLRNLRESMHEARSGKKTWSLTYFDWETFYSLATTQVLVIRRYRLALEAAETWWKLYSSCLVISAPRHGGLMRFEQQVASLPPTVRKQLVEGTWDEQADPRWHDVNDDTIVWWNNNDGKPAERTRFGDLMMQDRKTVEMAPDGTLHGGYPF